jgi:hypothetical protein
VGFAEVKVEVTNVPVKGMYVYGGVEALLHAFVRPSLDGSECPAFYIG